MLCQCNVTFANWSPKKKKKKIGVNSILHVFLITLTSCICYKTAFQFACLNKGRYLSFGTLWWLLCSQSKPLSHCKPPRYNIVASPDVKYHAPMTIYGQEFVVNPRTRKLIFLSFPCYHTTLYTYFNKFLPPWHVTCNLIY